jgi:CheY-like chemotaxis protein
MVLGLKANAYEEKPGIITRHNLPDQKGDEPKKVDLSLRILLVEDNKVNQKVALKVLSKIGYQADIASNGLEAIRILEHNRYDLVLMDCQMPELDGYDATRSIRNTKGDSPNKAVPIIAMTANAMKGDREKCIEAGMNDYISKPIDIIALSKAITKWI